MRLEMLILFLCIITQNISEVRCLKKMHATISLEMYVSGWDGYPKPKKDVL